MSLLKRSKKQLKNDPSRVLKKAQRLNPMVEKKTGGYKADDGGIFFEKYDKNGNVIFRTPPEQKPIDEHV